MASEKKTVYDELYNFQTRLQGVANDLGIKLAAVVSSTDKGVLDVLTKELPKGQKKSIEGEIRRLKGITDAVEKVRKKGFDTAKDTLFSTSLDVAKAGTSETAKEFNAALGEAARKEREKRFCKTLSDKQLKAIVEGQGIDGATIGDWFSGWKRDDLERISRAVQTATVEQLTVSDIAKLVRGTKENNYSDGVLGATRVSAVRLARTVVNGVCNNARVETIKENSDVIDGIKFVGTLDGKTCPHCASYDGHIWRGEDMASARRPPIHPNCRCTLVPYVELKDDDGNVVDIDNERPAANADFDQLAKDAYNEKAREKGWKRRFEDLSPSTRLKYYYQAQKDYEKETGKPAYRQVDSNLSFPEYFKQQPDSFKRAWLGAKRYEAYKDGKLSEKSIFAPDLGYTVSPTSLVKFVEPEVPETLAKLVDEYEKKGSPELPNPTSKNAIDYTKFVPDYDGETDVEVLRKRWEKLDLQELEKLSNDIWERSKAWRSYIWDFQPKKGDFSSKEDYDKAYEGFMNAYHHVFWTRLTDIVNELIEETKKKTTVPEIDYSQYKPEFRDSSDVDTILQSLQTLSVEELGKIRKEAFDEYLKWMHNFSQFSPERKDYATEEEHDKAWRKWYDFSEKINREFWHRILDGIDALKEQKEKDTENTGKRTRETSKKTKEKSKNTSRDSNKKVYKPIVAEIDGISDIDEIRRIIKTLPLTKIEAFREKVIQKQSEWERKVRESQPKQSEFSSRQDYEEAVELYTQIQDLNRIFWESVKEALPSEKIDIKKELDREVPQTSMEALNKIERLRENTYGKKKAEEENSLAEKRADLSAQVARIRCDIRINRKEFEDNNTSEERKKILEKEYNKMCVERTLAQESLDRQNRILKEKKEEKRKILEYLFPDRGGSSFFDEKSKKRILDFFEKAGKKEAAEEAIAFYDMIARTYNLNGTKLASLKNIVFKTLDKNTNGSYDNIRLRINLNSKLKKNNDEKLLTTLIHEIGHWFEQRGLGYERSTKNVEWLVKETGNKVKVKGHLPIDELINVMPNLCSRLDGYSKRIYPNGPSPGYYSTFHTSELISTAMEEAYRDIETFIRKSPRHFNLLLENLRGLTQ